MSECVRFGDGTIDITDDDTIGAVPQIDGGVTFRCALVLCSYTERDGVGPRLQVECFLCNIGGRILQFYVQFSISISFQMCCKLADSGQVISSLY